MEKYQNLTNKIFNVTIAQENLFHLVTVTVDHNPHILRTLQEDHQIEKNLKNMHKAAQIVTTASTETITQDQTPIVGTILTIKQTVHIPSTVTDFTQMTVPSSRHFSNNRNNNYSNNNRKKNSTHRNYIKRSPEHSNNYRKQNNSYKNTSRNFSKFHHRNNSPN